MTGDKQPIRLYPLFQFANSFHRYGSLTLSFFTHALTQKGLYVCPPRLYFDPLFTLPWPIPPPSRRESPPHPFSIPILPPPAHLALQLVPSTIQKPRSSPGLSRAANLGGGRPPSCQRTQERAALIASVVKLSDPDKPPLPKAVDVNPTLPHQTCLS